jgi:hypothetical protein
MMEKYGEAETQFLGFARGSGDRDDEIARPLFANTQMDRCIRAGLGVRYRPSVSFENQRSSIRNAAFCRRLYLNEMPEFAARNCDASRSFAQQKREE